MGGLVYNGHPAQPKAASSTKQPTKQKTMKLLTAALALFATATIVTATPAEDAIAGKKLAKRCGGGWGGSWGGPFCGGCGLPFFGNGFIGNGFIGNGFIGNGCGFGCGGCGWC